MSQFFTWSYESPQIPGKSRGISEALQVKLKA
jgi:hypothetical protein